MQQIREKIKEKSASEIILLNGWVKRIRKLGKLLFFDLHKGNGDLQIIIKDQTLINHFNLEISNGDLIEVKGKYQSKKEINKDSEKIQELLLEDWKIINKSSRLPFEIKNEQEIKEETKYRYRYLDLRREKSREILLYKHEFINYMRNFLYEENFKDIETPILAKSSPEGARTFIANSNIPDRFYTLPQSPQIFKQILMISGFDKYYQIAKNFRNEDARSNRQPEFLQLDLEVSFTNEEEIKNLMEKILIGFLISVLKVKEDKISFQSMTFKESNSKYGTDKPDLRNPIRIENFNFNLTSYSKKISKEEIVDELGVFIPLNFSFDFQKIYKIIKEKINSKTELIIFSKKEKSLETIYSNYKKENQLFIKDNNLNGHYIVMGGNIENIRSILLEIRGLYNKFIIEKNSNKEFRFLWITDWPLFEKNSTNNLSAFRHPFTLPKQEYIQKIINGKNFNPLSIITHSYDLVCNGEELASGSLRIFQRSLQEKIFELLGFNREHINKHFGYFLDALGFAAPPCGGIGMGIDRALAVFLNLKNLKEAIAFPKNIDGTCSLTGTPDRL